MITDCAVWLPVILSRGYLTEVTVVNWIIALEVVRFCC